MGKLEKLILLSILLAAAVVLAFSLNRKSDEVEASNPLAGSQQVLDREKGSAEGKATSGLPETFSPSAKTPDAQPNPAAAGSGSSSLLLNAGPLDAGQAPAIPPAKAPALSLEPESDPNRPILVDKTGLRPSFVDDYMVYIATESDTWSSLAQRFYGDGRYTRNLHQANDTMAELKPGDQLLVPVYDFIERDAGLQSASAPAAELAAAPSPSAPAPTAPSTSGKPADVAPKSGPVLVYEVKAGDTLSDIAQAVLGNASRWKEILDANKDVLQKPEGLQVGMKLKLPAGGKLPAAEPKKPADAKAKTAQAPPPKKSDTKKKVL